MSKVHTIYLIFHNGVFVDACLSYSEANRIVPWGESGWKIKRREAEDY